MLQVPFETGAEVALGRMRRHHEDSELHKDVLTTSGGKRTRRCELSHRLADWWLRRGEGGTRSTLTRSARLSRNQKATIAPTDLSRGKTRERGSSLLCRFGLGAVELLQFRHHFFREEGEILLRVFKRHARIAEYADEMIRVHA